MTIAFSPLWFGHDSGDELRSRVDAFALAEARVDTPVSPDDLVMVGRIRGGDEAAFEALFRKHYAGLCALAATYVRSSAVAEEVVSELFSWLWTHRATWSPRVSIAAALYGLARRRAIDVFRSARAEQRRYDVVSSAEMRWGASAAADAEAQVEADDARTLLWRCIASLPDSQRTVLTLRWRHGLSWEEIAAAMGTSVVAVKRQHSRALALIRDRFPEHLR